MASSKMKYVRSLLAATMLVLCAADGFAFANQKSIVDNEVEEFDFANGLFSRGMYDLAVDGFKEFLKKYPNSQYAELAAYRIGESYFLAQKYNEALNRFSVFLNDYPSGELAQKVLLRKGQTYYLKSDLAEAEKVLIPLTGSKDADVSVGARYYLAAISFKRKDLGKARGMLEGLVSSSDGSEYVSYAYLNLGDIHSEEKNSAKAAEAYAQAAMTAKDARTAQQGALRAANSYAKAGDYAKAAEFYAKVTDAEETSEFFDAAAVGLMSALNKGAKYDQAILSADSLLQRLSQDEAKAQVMYFRGNACLARKDMEGAKKAYAEAYAAYPSTKAGMKAGLNECWTLVELGAYDECLVKIEAYVQKTQNSRDEALYLKAKALAGLGRKDEAVAVYDQLASDIKDSSFSKEALYDRAWLYSKVKDAAKAVESFRKFAELYPDDQRSPAMRLRAAQENISVRRYKDAESDILKFLAAFKEDPLRENAMYLLGKVYMGMEDYDSAIKAFREFLKTFPQSGSRSAVAYLIGRSYQGKQEWDKAIGEYSTLTADPAGELYANAAESSGYCYFQKGDYANSAGWYYRIMTGKSDYKLHDSVYKWLADHYLKAGEMDKSLVALKGYMEKYPQAANGVELYYLFGENHRLLGEMDKAEEYYRKVIDSGTDSSALERSYLGMGTIYNQKGDYEKALEYLTKAVQSHKDNITGALARMEIANLRYKIMDYETAAKDYMMVAILYDDSDLCPKALYQAALSFEKAGKNDKALEALRELMARYPASAMAPEAEKEIKRIESEKKQ